MDCLLIISLPHERGVMKDSDSDMRIVQKFIRISLKCFNTPKKLINHQYCLPKQLLPQVRVVSFAYLATEEQTGSFGVK